jgi:nucleotide-binding universal stress UspA family protein
MIAIRNILVPTGGSDIEEDVVKLACTLAKRSKAKIYVVYIIEVERNLPLDTQVDSDTDKAEGILTRAEDAAADADYDVETDLLQARDAGPAIVGEAVQREVDLIVMGTNGEKNRGIFDLGKTARYVLKEAPCHVLLYRKPIPEAKQ